MPRPRLTFSLGLLGARLADLPASYWRVVAASLLSAVSAMSAMHDSAVVEGTRYFWLEDDMMISMRYGRNLAEGQGLVWNPGERVEGYTNFLWTVVMAAVHLLPVGDAGTSLVVRVVNWFLALAVVWQVDSLLRAFLPRPGLALPMALITVALSLDLVYWSVKGYETTLLTAMFLWVVLRLLDRSAGGRVAPSTYLMLGLLPVIRSDGYQIWVAGALVALGLSSERPRTVRLLALSLLPAAIHLLLRHWYYGDWLPNTYYLKVVGIEDRTLLGIRYLRRFVESYGVALALAVVGALLARDRRRWLLLASVPLAGSYAFLVGGDTFLYARFFAHAVPLVLVLAVVGAVDLAQKIRGDGRAALGLFKTTTPAARSFVLVLIVCGSVLLPAGAITRERLERGTSWQVTALLNGLTIARHSRPESSVAVFAAGTLPYFSRRHTVDLLGKMDRHIARQPTRTVGWVGHNKFDPDYSFGLAPDVVATHLSPPMVARFVGGEYIGQFVEGTYIPTMLGSAAFREAYFPNLVPATAAPPHTALYVRGSSPELASINSWYEPDVTR